MKKTIVFICIAILNISAFANELTSPDARFKLLFDIDNIDSKFFYSLSFEGKTVIDKSYLGFELKSEKQSDEQSNFFETRNLSNKKNDPKTDFFTGFRIVNCIKSQHDDVWKPVWGEESEIRNNYNQIEVELYQEKNEISFACID